MFALIIVAASNSCTPKTPLNSLRRSDIAYITLADCASREYPVADNRLVDQLWHAVLHSRKSSIETLRLNTGFVRVKITQNHVEDPIQLNIVASIRYGPVIRYGTDLLVCDECEIFFRELKKTHPDFNWCEAPMIK